jgi:hypothetical protein
VLPGFVSVAPGLLTPIVIIVAPIRGSWAVRDPRSACTVVPGATGGAVRFDGGIILVLARVGAGEVVVD